MNRMKFCLPQLNLYFLQHFTHIGFLRFAMGDQKSLQQMSRNRQVHTATYIDYIHTYIPNQLKMQNLHLFILLFSGVHPLRNWQLIKCNKSRTSGDTTTSTRAPVHFLWLITQPQLTHSCCFGQAARENQRKCKPTNLLVSKFNCTVQHIQLSVMS